MAAKRIFFRSSSVSLIGTTSCLTSKPIGWRPGGWAIWRGNGPRENTGSGKWAGNLFLSQDLSNPKYRSSLTVRNMLLKLVHSRPQQRLTPSVAGYLAINFASDYLAH